MNNLTEAYILLIKQNAEESVVVSKDNGPEVNAAKTKYSGALVYELNPFLEAVRKLKCS
jgi:hypothetical protein